MANELTINPKTIVSELQKMKGQIEAALPRHMTPDRMARIALTALRVTPKLFQCTPESFYGSIIAASQLGLEPGVNGQCYLIPYGNTCTLVPGWKGLMDLVSRAGRSSAWTGAVKPGDFFEYSLGSSPKVTHEPGDDDSGEFTHVYAVGWVKDAQWPILEVWSRAKVMRHLKQNNKVGDKHYALAGKDNLEMYGRKVVLLQVIKYLPSSIELRDASALDVAAAEGKQALTIDMAFKGDLTGGGPSEDAAEAEGLMEQLNWPDDKREMFRSNYASKMADGLAYLKSEVQRAGRGNQQQQSQPATQQGTSQAQPTDPTPQQQVQQATGRRPRTRGAQQSTPEGDTSADGATRPTEESPSANSSTTGREEQRTEQTEQPNMKSFPSAEQTTQVSKDWF